MVCSDQCHRGSAAVLQDKDTEKERVVNTGIEPMGMHDVEANRWRDILLRCPGKDAGLPRGGEQKAG